MSKPITAAGLPLTAISDSSAICKVIINQTVEKAIATAQAVLRPSHEDVLTSSVFRLPIESAEKIEYILALKIVVRPESISFNNCIVEIVRRHLQPNRVLTLKFLSPAHLVLSHRPKPAPTNSAWLLQQFNTKCSTLLGFDATFLPAKQFLQFVKYRLILMVLQGSKVDAATTNQIFMESIKKLTDDILYESYEMYAAGAKSASQGGLKFIDVIEKLATDLGCEEEDKKRYIAIGGILKLVQLCPNWTDWTRDRKHAEESRNAVIQEVLKMIREYATRIFAFSWPRLKESIKEAEEHALVNKSKVTRLLMAENMTRKERKACEKRVESAASGFDHIKIIMRRHIHYHFEVLEKCVRRLTYDCIDFNHIREVTTLSKKSLKGLDVTLKMYLEDENKRDLQGYTYTEKCSEKSINQAYADYYEPFENVKNALFHIYIRLSKASSMLPSSFSLPDIDRAYLELHKHILDKCENIVKKEPYSKLGALLIEAADQFENSGWCSSDDVKRRYFRDFLELLNLGLSGLLEMKPDKKKWTLQEFKADFLVDLLDKVKELQFANRLCVDKWLFDVRRKSLGSYTRNVEKDKQIVETGIQVLAKRLHLIKEIKDAAEFLCLDLFDLLTLAIPPKTVANAGQGEWDEAWLTAIDMEATNEKNEKENAEKNEREKIAKKHHKTSRKSNAKKQENREVSAANLGVVPATAASSNDRFDSVEKATTLLDLLGKVQLACERSANVSYEGLTPTVYRRMAHPEKTGELYKQIYQMQQMHALNMLQASLMVLGHARDPMSKDVVVGIAMHWASLVAEQVSSQRYAERFQTAVHEHSNAEICRMLGAQPPEYLTAHVNMASRYRRYSYACAPKVSARTALALRHMWNKAFKPNDETIKEFYYRLPDMMGELVAELMNVTDAAVLVGKYKARTMELAAKDMHAQAASSETIKREIATIPALDGYLKKFHAFLESAAKAETIPADQLKDLWLAFNQLKAIAQGKTLLLESPTQPTLYWHASTFYFSVFYFAELLGMYWSKKTDNAFYSHDLEMYELCGLASGLTYEEWTTLLTVNLGKAFEYPYYEAHRTKHKEESVLSKELSRLQAYSQVPSGFTPKNHPPKSNEELYASHIRQMNLLIPIIMKMLDQVMRPKEKQ